MKKTIHTNKIFGKRTIGIVCLFALFIGAMLFAGCNADKDKPSMVDGTAHAAHIEIMPMAQTGDDVYVYITSNLDGNVRTILADPYDYDLWSVDKVDIYDVARGSEYILIRVENMNKLINYSDNQHYYVISDHVTLKYVYGIILPAAPSKEGHTFTGWFFDEACTNRCTETVIEANTTLYAGWARNEHSVTFVYGNGQSDAIISRYYGDKIVRPTPPTRTGHDFLGWYTSETGGTQYNFDSTVTGNVRLYARWQIQVFTVTFMVDGEVYKSIDVEYGTILTEAPAVQRLLRTFAFDTTDAVTAQAMSAPVTGTVTVSAVLNPFSEWLLAYWWVFVVAIVVLLALLAFLIVKTAKKR